MCGGTIVFVFTQSSLFPMRSARGSLNLESILAPRRCRNSQARGPRYIVMGSHRDTTKSPEEIGQDSGFLGFSFQRQECRLEPDSSTFLESIEALVVLGRLRWRIGHRIPVPNVSAQYRSVARKHCCNARSAPIENANFLPRESELKSGAATQQSSERKKSGGTTKAAPARN